LDSHPAERALGVLVDIRLKSSHQCALAAQRANSTLGCIKHSIASRSKEIIILLYLALCGLTWSTVCSSRPQNLKKDVKVLECIQGRATNLVEGPEGMCCEERMRTLVLSSLEKTRLRGNLTALYSFLRRGLGEGSVDLFSLASSDRTHGNGSKLCPGRFRTGR